MQQEVLPWPGNHPTHVHPVETAVVPETSPLGLQIPDTPESLIDTFRHSGWKPDRERVYDALMACNVSYGRRSSFARCGSSFWILRHQKDRDLFRVVPDHCHDRFCIPCGAQRQAVVRRNLSTRLRDGPHRFLTLTIKNDGEPLADLIKHLYASFRRLRTRAFWKRNVTGGAAFLEMTYSEDRESWHPHLHCMLEGRYLDLQELIRSWLAATGDSRNVKIKIVRERRHVIDYISKYATKPLPACVLRREPCLREAIHALHGRRMILTFGLWKAWKLLDDPKDAGWELFEHFNAVKWHAEDGDTLCQSIMAMLHTADADSGEFVAIDDGPPAET